MQTRNRLLDDIARVANGAAGVATGMREEVEALVQERVERVLSRLNLVTREEFEAVKAMAAKARSEQEALETLASLDAKYQSLVSGLRPEEIAQAKARYEQYQARLDLLLVLSING